MAWPDGMGNSLPQLFPTQQPNYMGALAMGLRSAAGVLNPQVQNQLMQQDQMRSEMLERRRALVAQQIIKAAEAGAIAPEVAQQQLQRLGLPGMPIGPSAETQQRLALTKRDAEFRAAIEGLGPDPDPAKMAALATQFGKPELAVSMYNAQQAREQRAEAATALLTQKSEAAQRQHEFNMGRLTNEQDRIRETARHNQMMESFRQEGLALRRALGGGSGGRPLTDVAKLNEDLKNGRITQAQYDAEMAVRKANQPAKDSTGVAGETAGKVAMADQAVMDIRTARGILFDKDGKLRREMVAAMNVPFTAGMPGNTDARLAYSSIYNAIEAKLRIETGAAATAREVESIANRFLPKISDSPAVVKERLDRLEQFMNTTLDQTKGVRPEALKSRKAAPATPTQDDDGWSVKEKK